ncbi:unnamed protein product, partial [Polarella glacialis]
NMPRGNDSFGVFISQTAVATLSKDDINRLTYATTTGNTFCGSQISPEDRDKNESFMEVYSTGRRATKYMGYPMKKAPNFDRSSSRYYSEYVAFPLGDSKANNASAKNYKEAGSSRARNGGKLDGRTSYMQEFGNKLTTEQMENAKGISAEPLQDTLKVVSGKLLYNTALSHDTFK